MSQFRKTWPVFSKLATREDALQAIRNAALFLEVLAGAYLGTLLNCERSVAAGHPLPPGTFLLMIAHTLIYGAGGLFLYRSNGRILAILMFGVITFGAIVEVKLLFERHAAVIPSFSALLQLLAFWGSLRAIEATFKLHGRFATTKAPS
jgi:hypothetical protein